MDDKYGTIFFIILFIMLGILFICTMLGTLINVTLYGENGNNYCIQRYKN